MFSNDAQPVIAWPLPAAPQHVSVEQGGTLYQLGGGLQLLTPGALLTDGAGGLPLQLHLHELRQHLLQQHHHVGGSEAQWLLDSDGHLNALAATKHLHPAASSLASLTATATTTTAGNLQHSNTGGLSSLSNASALTATTAINTNNHLGSSGLAATVSGAAAAAAADIMISSGSLSALPTDLAQQQQGGGTSATGGAAGASSSSPAGSASLYVKNLHADADELYLYQKFAPHGALLSCKVKTDPTTGKCRGVGFVNFVDQACALRAMQQLHGSRTSEGRQLHITLQAPRAVRAAAAAAAAAACPLPHLPSHHPAGAALLLHDPLATHVAAAAGRVSALPAGVFSPYAPSPPVQQTTIFSHQAPSVVNANARLHF